MIRISHLDLGLAQRDPTAWLRAKAAAGPRKRGYNQILKEAIYTFHRENSDASAARESLRRGISNADLHNASRIFTAELELDAYMEWCLQTSLIVTNHRLRISLPLNSSVTMGGEISRVDYVAGIYRAVLLVSAWAPNWDDELRMPLIQSAVAGRLERDESDVSVAMQQLGGGELVARRFTSRELDAARAAGRRVALSINERQAQADAE